MICPRLFAILEVEECIADSGIDDSSGWSQDPAVGRASRFSVLEFDMGFEFDVPLPLVAIGQEQPATDSVEILILKFRVNGTLGSEETCVAGIEFNLESVPILVGN